MGVKISNLPLIVAPNVTDLLPVVQNGITYKETMSQLVSLFTSIPNLSFITPDIGAATATSINFGGSTLGNYASEISFPPTITFATPGDLSVVYDVQQGLYTRIGSVVFYRFVVVFAPTFTTASGNFQVMGAPIPCTSIPSLSCNGTGGSGASPTWPAGVTQIVCRITSGTSFFLISGFGSGVGVSTITTTGFTSGVSATVSGSGFYFV